MRHIAAILLFVLASTAQETRQTQVRRLAADWGKGEHEPPRIQTGLAITEGPRCTLKADDDILVTGTVKNVGSKPISEIELQIRLYGAKKYIGIAWAHKAAALAPGAAWKFSTTKIYGLHDLKSCEVSYLGQ